jgi:hypothetical protein
MTQPVNPLNPKAAPLTSQSAAAKRLDTTLAKLTAATAVKPTQSDDGASLTQTNVLKAVRETAPLRELGAKLIDLRKLLAQSPKAAPNAAAQSALDKVAASIDAVTATPPSQTTLLFDRPYLDLSGEKNDAEALLRLELSGPRGVQQLSFTSGTSIADIAATLDLVGADLAVSARLSGNAIVIESEARQGREFVGVRVLDSGDANFANDTGSALGSLLGALEASRATEGGADLLTLIDDAIREVERAEREVLLGRAGGDVALTESDIPVIREAQAKLLDEARRLGLLVDHDPAKAFEALRG